MRAERIIPLQDVERVRIYINEDRLPLRDVVAQQAPDIAITGVYYTSAWRPTCHLKADGVVLADDPSYQPPGLAWDRGPDIHQATVPDHLALNYLSCCLLTASGAAEPKLYYNADVGEARGRTAVWLRGQELGVYACTDGADALTPEALQARLEEEYAPYTAIMLDGGSKINYYDRASGTLIQGGQPSQNLLLIYLKKKEESPMDGVTRSYIAKSDCYQAGRTITPKGIMIHSTATPGVMAEAMRERWDRSGMEEAVHAVIDGSHTIQLLPWTHRAWHAGTPQGGGVSANNTHIAVEICEPQECRLLPEEWIPLKRGSTGWAVERLQRELQARGYDPKGIDGSFGPGCDAALRQCQADLGLDADGSCGPATREALAAREGSYLEYEPQDTTDYFEAAVGRAVALCAQLCVQYGIDPGTGILDHAEGYRRGIASNHADVGHWFPRHGLSMAGFRAAVLETVAMSGGHVSELDTAVDKLAAAGLIDSPDYWKGGAYSTENVQALLIKWAASI